MPDGSGVLRTLADVARGGRKGRGGGTGFRHLRLAHSRDWLVLALGLLPFLLVLATHRENKA